MPNQPARKAREQLVRAGEGEIQAEEFNLQSLSAQERAQANKIATAINAIMLKGLLNRADPARYPVVADSERLENQSAALARTIKPQAFERLRPRLMSLASDPARLQRMLGDHAGDLNAVGIDRKVEPLLPPRSTATAPANVVPRSGHLYNRAHLILRALHCVDETNPENGTDDMVLAGLRIGASGNVGVINGIVCGEFNDDTYRNFGEMYLGQYSLNTTPGYPKHLYAIFKLVESDSDDREVAEQLTSTLSFLASTILSVLTSPMVGATVGALISSIGGFISNLIDEDEFPPYGIRLTLNSEGQFGGPVGPKFHTGNISGHGGSYRLGLRWVLAP